MTRPSGLVDLDALNGPPKDARARGCQVGQLLARLTDSERELVNARLEDPAWPRATIARALNVSPSALGYHARKVCTCE